jgi:hypothetical protein
VLQVLRQVEQRLFLRQTLWVETLVGRRRVAPQLLLAVTVETLWAAEAEVLEQLVTQRVAL